MLSRAEVARAAVYAAGVTLDGRAGATRSGRLPRPSCWLGSRDGQRQGRIQVHGGMGFTWEVDTHLYLKRAAGLAAAFSQPDELAEAVAASL